MKASNIFLLLVVTAFVVVVIVPRMRGPAADPSSFSGGSAVLDAALDDSEGTGKPVVVLVTADWCAPCQTLKRNLANDADVNTWLDENVVAISLVDGQDDEAIRKLQVRAFPTSFVIRDREIVGKLEGATSAANYQSWVQGAMRKEIPAG